MINTLKISIILIIFFTCTEENYAQFSGLKTFGSFQSIFLYQKIGFDALEPFKQNMGDTTNSSFLLQQFDIFFQHSLTDKLSLFSDIEMKTNFNTEKNWGFITIQEAWINYSFNDQINVKFGSLFPEFNYLNSIRNRFNLFPYIYRPIVYESSFSNYIPQEDFIPERAFIELYGVQPIKYFNLEYALYMGNSEASYYAQEPKSSSIITLNYLNSIDSKTLKYKLYGLKIELNKSDDSFKFGISLTHDYNNLNDSTHPFRELNSFVMVDSIPVSYKTISNPIMGDVPRFRFGIDLSFAYNSFKFEGEYIKVHYYDINYDRVTIDERPNIKLGGEFYYGTLIYNFDESIYLFASFNKYNDKFIRMEITYFTIGGGYRLFNNTTIKFNYLDFNALTKSYTWVKLYNLQPIKLLVSAELWLKAASFGLSVNF